MAIRSFDIISYLDEENVPFDAEGKNISEGWIGLNCPFCDDPSNHLGINLEDKRVSCWRCGKKTLIRMICRISNVSVSRAKTIISRHQDRGVLSRRKPASILDNLEDTDIALPSSARKVFPELHTEWLKKRNFNPAEVIRKYNLHACYQTGKYKYRIIAPIYVARRMVSFVGRDVTEEADSPYLNLPNEESIMPIRRCLYNIDSVDRVALVVEGVTDVWRFGRGAVATLGLEFTKAQINLLSGLDKVFVMFDAGRQETSMARKFAAMATSVVKSAEVIKLTTGDPDKLPQDVVDQLKFEIFGRR
jgi:DNA primase